MIKYFRRFRQRLISENLPSGQAGKFSKYLLYAIGEIVLVVIGILIALSLNNWNQNITYKNELKLIIKEVHNDLNQDLSYLNEEVNNIKIFNNNIDNLLNNGNNMSPDSLLNAITKVHSVTSFIPVNFGYNKLNKHPRTDILSDSLLNNLSIYYSKFSNQMNNTSFEGLSMYSLNLFRDYLIKYGFPLTNRNLEGPKDLSILNNIINDIEFIGILRNNKYNRSVQLSGFIEARKQVEKSLEMINEYLTHNH
jgi:hypothetical protein